METNKLTHEYWKMIYKVQDYIENNPNTLFTSEELSIVSGLSKYHFHRIFKGMTGESLFEYIKRIKMEWACEQLTNQTDESITHIAYELGYSDSTVFSRTFKSYYGISPREYRNNCQVLHQHNSYDNRVARKGTVVGDVRIELVEEMRVIYKRRIGSYSELTEYTDDLVQLYKHASVNKLLIPNSNPLAIYHSHPDFVEDENERTSIAMIVNSDVRHVDDETIGVMDIPGGLYAITHFEIDHEEYPEAWSYVYDEWLVNSNYLPANSFPFEVYLNDPTTHPTNKHVVEIYVPIKRIGNRGVNA